MKNYKIRGGNSKQLGAIHDGEGVNFAVFSQHASHIELCLFEDQAQDGKYDNSRVKEVARLKLPERSGPIWHGYVGGLPVGTLYGFRAHGEYNPEAGQRFNANKLLMDPYTRELGGQWINDSAVLGYEEDALEFDLSFDQRDSAAFVPKSVVSDPTLFQLLQHQPAPMTGSQLIYEAHVKGLTQTHEKVPNCLRGTYEGLASDAMIEHLKSLGISTIELLPVHSFIDDAFLVQRKLTNYWGYNTMGFFAPEPRYFGPHGLIGFRKMVDKLKRHGIGVILDVVYNHTGEGDHRGPTLCYRGLDNASYYRLNAERPRYYDNDTGCGNTVNVAHPHVLRLVLDSLRFWVQCMGVDGFRFDLATTLGREDHGFDANGGFFDALRQDPVLANVRLIAEPWDIGPGGYQLGEFPHQFGEWNDNFRDSVRKYWKGDNHSSQELAAGLLGSAKRFDRDGRSAGTSVNFVSSHDGFTLVDICRYLERHNLANGENNEDGHDANYSDNCGVEGVSDDPKIHALRSRRQRNMLATVFLSQGTPMLLAGDEMGNSQQGNNNAYCQDNEIGWVNWDKADLGLQEFVRALSNFRDAHPVLYQHRFLHGAQRRSDGYGDVEWTDFAGGELQWDDPELSNFCLILRGSAETSQDDTDSEDNGDSDMVVVIVNRQDQPAIVTLPIVTTNQVWRRGIDTASKSQHFSAEYIGETVSVKGHSVVALSLKTNGDD